MNHLLGNLRNLPGWRSDKKFVVFESDDWGSIRMPSLSSFEKLKNSGLDLSGSDAERYNLNDTLATSADLEYLFDLMSNFKDCNGNHPVFTAVSVVANPDFEKIKETDFSRYFWEPFTETLKKYHGCENSFELWKKGIEERFFVPQFHGREHLNVLAWMRALQNGDRQTHLAFNEGLWGFVPDSKLNPGIDYQSAFLLSDPADIDYQKEVIIEGLELFEKLFGYKAEYFVPPNGFINNQLNNILAESGIKLRSTAKLQRESLGGGKIKKSFHWLGQKDKSGLLYVSRNCFFEPSQSGKDWVNECLYEISTAFRWHKPAIISTHRVNYIGSLNPLNRSDEP